MRWRAACAVMVVTLAGCNQIFGLKPTKEFDAAVDVIPEAPLPRVQLTLQVATVQADGQPSDTVTFAPITPAPRVRIATRDGAFTDATYGADGSIEFPQSFVGTPWRLEYTLGTAAPVEVQWSPGDGQGHLIVPLFGRLDRDPPPIGGGYKIMASSATSFTFPRVFTTGMWTETTTFVSKTAPLAETDFGNAMPLSGGKGAPLAAKGDRGLLVDFEVVANCRKAVGAGDFAPDLTTTHTAVSAAWTTSSRIPNVAGVDINAFGRFTTGLHNLATGNPIAGDQLYGYVPSAQMPGFTEQILGPTLPVPLMLVMAQCLYNAAVPPASAPEYLEGMHFPRVLHAQLVDRRMASGVTLSSGEEVDAPATMTTPQGDKFNATFPAAIPAAFQLETPGHQMIDLAGTTENVVVPPASGTFVLSYTPETGHTVDYTDVTLHEITGGSLLPIRTFTFGGTSVPIDGSLLAPGKHYVFEVRTHAGVPMAAQGDFTQITYPQGLAIVFTRTIAT